jgi:hypothetical protein
MRRPPGMDGLLRGLGLEAKAGVQASKPGRTARSGIVDRSTVFGPMDRS